MSSSAQQLPYPKAISKRNALHYVRYRVGYWLVVFCLLVGTVLMLAPFAWAVATSLRLPAESLQG